MKQTVSQMSFSNKMKRSGMCASCTDVLSTRSMPSW